MNSKGKFNSSQELLPCPCGNGYTLIYDIGSDIADLGRYQCSLCSLNFSEVFNIRYDGLCVEFFNEEEALESWNNGVKNIFKGNQYKDYPYETLTKHLNHLKKFFHYDVDPLEYRVSLIKEGCSQDVVEFETIKHCGMKWVIRHFEECIEKERRTK